jgi:hypothetical protein
MGQKGRYTTNNDENNTFIRNGQAPFEGDERFAINFPYWISNRFNNEVSDNIKSLNSISNGICWQIDEVSGQGNYSLNIFPDNKFYKKEINWGSYFGVEEINWHTLKTNDDDLIYFFFGYVIPRSDQKIIRWQEELISNIRNEEKELNEKGYILKHDKNPNHLIISSAKKYLNIELLSENPMFAIINTVDDFMKFVINNLKYLKPILL